MATYTLVEVRKLTAYGYQNGRGISTTAYRGYYKINPKDSKEIPQTIIKFGEHALEELNRCKTIEAEVVTVPLNGTYEYPNGSRIKETQVFCPTVINEVGVKMFAQGYNPEEIATRRTNFLKRV